MASFDSIGAADTSELGQDRRNKRGPGGQKEQSELPFVLLRGRLG